MSEPNPEIEESMHETQSVEEEMHTELCEQLIGREHEVLKLLKYQDYMSIITPLQEELVKLQEWVKENGLKIVVLFEGRDAAGKGGTIKRFMEFLNPRICRVVALDKPTERESVQWYFQRYVPHLPSRGEIVLFDRSWYNRAVVERVMGFCTEVQVGEFYQTVPEFERMLVRSGIHLNKFWFSVSRGAQEKRFASRENDLRKTWKLSPVDQQSRDKWDQYTRAKEDMFRHTDISQAPWRIIKSDNKKQARINSIRYFLSQFDYSGKESAILEYDPAIVRTVEEEMGID
ncbi:MAG: polyphosphate kinase 2 [Gammaproteobacteria bacterium]|nr:polyphosphate kinase 2 [Gammaproteobacteria bacterium]